jgi:steroid 5-alpha reductase family enzyme
MPPPELLAQAKHLALVSVAIMVGLMLLLWLIHLLIRNAALVDVGWAGGLAVVAIYFAAAGPGYHARKYAIGSMAAIWGFRLAAYLIFARVVGQPEEGRYTQLRKEWKTNLPLRFLFLFEFQALLVVLLSLPFLLACVNPAAPLHVIEKIAAGFWLLAAIAEGIADQQLANFKKNPANKGKTCRSGLWRYSRHPNYFFDWLVWVAYALFALGSPWGWLGLISPALLLYFLLGITGIPATEAQAVRSRGAEYREYQRTTNVFVPWFPKKSPSEAGEELP